MTIHKLEGNLVNTLYRAVFDKIGRRIFRHPLRVALENARRFVLDESMSAFMADLGWAAFKAKPELTLSTMDSIRRLARAPFPVTWIEWDEPSLAKRARTEYQSSMREDMVPRKSGWLIFRHPQIETAHMALSFGFGNAVFNEDVGMILNNAKENTIGLCPFGIMWNTEGDVLPWQIHDVKLTSMSTIPISGLLAGLCGYHAPVAICDASTYFNIRTHSPQELEALFREQFGMVRYIFALLASINDVPVVQTEARTSKGFVAQGRYRKFLDTTGIKITLPVKRYKVLARRTVIALRRRAHEVRGHWREDWRHPLSASCAHSFIRLPDQGKLECSHCKGRRTWITDHIRGDLSLGFVSHNYTVTHDPESPKH